MIISAGLKHFIAIKNKKIVSSWINDAEGTVILENSHFYALPKEAHNHIVSVSAGRCFCLAIDDDGKVYEWAIAAFTSEMDAHHRVSIHNTNPAILIDSGIFFNITLFKNNEILVGGNYINEWYGDLKTPPIEATNLSNPVIDISIGIRHIVALRTDGRVVAWGDNTYGQCNIPQELNNVMAVSANGLFSLALTKRGHVVAWGNNDFGQCDIPKDLCDVKAIAAGSRFGVALKRNGTVVAWGMTSYSYSISTRASYHLDATNNPFLKKIKEDKIYKLLGDMSECNLKDIVTVTAGLKGQIIACKNDGSVHVWGYRRPTLQNLCKLTNDKYIINSEGCILMTEKGTLFKTPDCLKPSQNILNSNFGGII